MGDAAAAASPVSTPGKRKRGADEGAAALRRVAEIVMVLAAAGEVRGGRKPTAAERALAAEARERLAAAVAEGAVRPKDLFPGEAVRAVVEDLGLNRAKDPAAMGFRPPKASIADRLMITKRKMEEAPVQPPISAPQPNISSGMSEFQGLHGASKFGAGAPRNAPAVAALATTAPLNSASLVILKPPGSSPVKPVTNASAGAVHHTGPSHLKLEKDGNGHLNLARSGAAMVHSAKSTPEISARSSTNSVQSSNQVVSNQDTKPVANHAGTGNPVMGHRATPGIAFAQTKPTFANHNDIAKNVQQFLHQPTNHPSWTPPSTEYMRSRLTCQICKVSILDSDSLLVCDSCERGAHLICLQHYGNKGIPKGEWHCSACLTQSKGKPLPPKYGKVTRTAVSSKAAPPGNGAQFSLQGSAENTTAKENHQKLAANANFIKSISTQVSSTADNSNVLALSATMAGSQSQFVSTLRPSAGNAIKAETSSNEKEGPGQPCSSTTQHNMNSPPDKSSRISLNSADSADDIMHGKQNEEVSGKKCSNDSLAVGTEPKIKSEAHSEPLPSKDVAVVDNSGTQMEQIKTVSTEEKPRIQATFESMKDAEATTSTRTSMDQGSNFATEEKHCSEEISEPDTINDVEMTANAGRPLCQSISAALDQNLQTDPASEPHTIEDMKMSTNEAPPIDQSNNLADEEKPSEQTSAINDVEFTSHTGTPTDQKQHADGSTENGIGPPSGEACVEKPGCNAASDHDSEKNVAPNGVLHPKHENSFVHKNGAMVVSTESREAN